MLKRQESLDRMFHALADPSRRDMVRRLVRRPAPVSELARPYAMSMSAVVQHLKVLEASGLVRSEKVGRVRTARIVPRALDSVDRWVAEHRTRLERRLDRLETYLDADPQGDKEETMAERTVRHATIVIQRSFRHAPARVFSAWANAEERRRWDVPGNDWVIASHEQDFRVGGHERSRFGPKNDPAYLSEGTFLDIVPDARIVMAGTMADRDVRMTATLCTVELYPEGSGTRMVFTDQSAFFGQETEADRRQGWGEILDRLEAYLERPDEGKEH
jgi:uncharacterized protein YndB with AHSA1/START domain/DNA-binding transcriptional ArsR family regulator